MQDAELFRSYITLIGEDSPDHLAQERRYVRAEWNRGLNISDIGVFGYETIERNNIGSYYLQGFTSKKIAALTFDDGPSFFTSGVLDMLKKYDAKATFFLTGTELVKFPELARRAIAEGHSLGNHTLNHLNNGGRTPEDLWVNVVDANNDLFEEILGFRPRFFRPSFGAMSDAQAKLLAEKNMKTIIWSIEVNDWDTDNVSSADIVNTVNDFLHEEAIVLMHDAGGDRQNSVNALEEIITFYQGRGYRLTTVDEVIGVSDKL